MKIIDKFLDFYIKLIVMGIHLIKSDLRQADGYFLPRLTLNLHKIAISLALATLTVKSGEWLQEIES